MLLSSGDSKRQDPQEWRTAKPGDEIEFLRLLRFWITWRKQKGWLKRRVVFIQSLNFICDFIHISLSFLNDISTFKMFSMNTYLYSNILYCHLLLKVQSHLMADTLTFAGHFEFLVYRRPICKVQIRMLFLPLTFHFKFSLSIYCIYYIH